MPTADAISDSSFARVRRRGQVSWTLSRRRQPGHRLEDADVRDSARRSARVIGKARNRKALIIDLRGNAGGYVAAMLEMVKQVNRDSVVVGSVQERRKTSPLIAKGGGSNAFAGDLYVLVDSRSASASEMFARATQLSKRGKVIGDHTAGAVMQALYFPLSIGMETRMLSACRSPMPMSSMADGGRLERVGVTPDESSPHRRGSRCNTRPGARAGAHVAGLPIDAAKAGALYPQNPVTVRRWIPAPPGATFPLHDNARETRAARAPPDIVRGRRRRRAPRGAAREREALRARAPRSAARRRHRFVELDRFVTSRSAAVG